MMKKHTAGKRKAESKNAQKSRASSSLKLRHVQKSTPHFVRLGSYEPVPVYSRLYGIKIHIYFFTFYVWHLQASYSYAFVHASTTSYAVTTTPTLLLLHICCLLRYSIRAQQLTSPSQTTSPDPRLL